MSQLERQFLRNRCRDRRLAAMPAFQGLHLLAAAGRPSAAKGNGGGGTTTLEINPFTASSDGTGEPE